MVGKKKCDDLMILHVAGRGQQRDHTGLTRGCRECSAPNACGVSSGSQTWKMFCHHSSGTTAGRGGHQRNGLEIGDDRLIAVQDQTQIGGCCAVGIAAPTQEQDTGKGGAQILL